MKHTITIENTSPSASSALPFVSHRLPPVGATSLRPSLWVVRARRGLLSGFYASLGSRSEEELKGLMTEDPSLSKRREVGALPLRIYTSQGCALCEMCLSPRSIFHLLSSGRHSERIDEESCAQNFFNIWLEPVERMKITRGIHRLTRACSSCHRRCVRSCLDGFFLCFFYFFFNDVENHRVARCSLRQGLQTARGAAQPSQGGDFGRGVRRSVSRGGRDERVGTYTNDAKRSNKRTTIFENRGWGGGREGE